MKSNVRDMLELGRARPTRHWPTRKWPTRKGPCGHRPYHFAACLLALVRKRSMLVAYAVGPPVKVAVQIGRAHV